MNILITLNPLGLGLFNFRTKTLKIIKVREGIYRIYGLEIVDNFAYIGLTYEIVKLDITNIKDPDYEPEKNIVWDKKFHNLHQIHSITIAPDNNLWATSTTNDRVYKISPDGELIDIFYLKDIWKVPVWYKELDNWDDCNLGTSKQWTHLNYFKEISPNKFLYSLFQMIDDDYYPKHTGQVGSIIKEGDVSLVKSYNADIKSPHCIIPYKNSYLVADSGNDRLIKLTERIPSVQQILLEDVRLHDIELIGNTGILVFGDCIREKPRLLIFDLNTNKIVTEWAIPKDLQAFAREHDNYIQPYTVKLLMR